MNYDSFPDVVDLEGRVDPKGIMYIGKATRIEKNLYRVLANVGDALCVVEVSLSDPEWEWYWSSVDPK